MRAILATFVPVKTLPILADRGQRGVGMEPNKSIKALSTLNILFTVGEGTTRISHGSNVCQQGPNFLTLKEPKNRFQGTNSPGCVAWRAGTTTLFVLGS
jgi:hypothetical protein